MRQHDWLIALFFPALVCAADSTIFQTSDRCIACHNGLITPSGQDVSIAADWRSSLMANSSRDPYWQASVRREIIDHAGARSAIEDECSVCHMPMTRFEAKERGMPGQIFTHLPLTGKSHSEREAADGVSCSVCHQITTQALGSPSSFNGGFVIAPPSKADARQEYGPFEIDSALKRIMHSSTQHFEPHQSDHVRSSELCATCHTLYTRALDERGAEIGTLPEQMPYQEWLHSNFARTRSCQSCHMPVVTEPVQISRVLGEPRTGVARHTFVAANFFMQRMLNAYRDELSVEAPADELAAATARTRDYLHSSAAAVEITHVASTRGKLEIDLHVRNLGGHKLPTAYPSRRAWLHVRVIAADDKVVFESGALQPDGSIAGNDNDIDATRFEPHYRVIDRSDEVQIYESIMGDAQGRVVTGLLSAVSYRKDNRLLPDGFNKQTAAPEIAVRGEAAEDPDFTDQGDSIRYSIETSTAKPPLRVDAQLLYQPIGFRWAANLKSYDAAETRRFSTYYESLAPESAATLASVSITVPQTIRQSTQR